VKWDWRKSDTLKDRTPADIANQKRLFGKYLEMLKAMERAGVGLLAGTDSGLGGVLVYPGFSVHDEMQLFVRAGLTPEEALRTATVNAARYLGKLNDLGTIERGKIPIPACGSAR
jgi:imidazolonepropionase-like amidohydrolase